MRYQFNMRRNWIKYQKRRSIRDEWKKRLANARMTASQGEYGRIITEYMIVTQKIRRHYPWLQLFTGRMC